MRVRVPTFTRFFDGEPAPGAAPSAPSPSGGTPAPTPAPSPAPAASPSAPAPGSPAPSSPASPAPQTFSFPEDRSTWLSRDQVNEIIRQRVGSVAQDRDRYRAMLEAGTGIRPNAAPQPLSAEESQAADLVIDLISRKTGLSFDKVKQALEQFEQTAPALQQSTDMQWSAHGNRMLHSLFGEVGQALGVEKLEPFQQSTIGNAFAAWLQSDQQLVQRYTWGDPTLAKDFVASWTRSFVDPVRRAAQAPAAATARQNAGLPAAPQPGGVAPPAGQPAAAQTEDQVHDAAWQAIRALHANRQAV